MTALVAAEPRPPAPPSKLGAPPSTPLRNSNEQQEVKSNFSEWGFCVFHPLSLHMRGQHVSSG